LQVKKEWNDLLESLKCFRRQSGGTKSGAWRLLPALDEASFALELELVGVCPVV
jgi:hypothetical protein